MAKLNTLQLWYSTTAGNKPTTAQLALGELAINLADAKLYMRAGTSEEAASDTLIESKLSGGTFAELADVLISSPASGQFLQYSTDGKWKNVSLQLAELNKENTFAEKQTFSKGATISALPSASTDVVNKAYVDALKEGIVVKHPVKALSMVNVDGTYANGTAGVGATLTVAGLLTVDGVKLAVGDRVLLAGQTNKFENGIYVVTSATVLTRAGDFDGSAEGEVVGGAFAFVQEGTKYADSGFVLATDGAIVIGKTGLTFVQFTGAGQITAGNGLKQDGNTLSIDPAYTGGSSISTVGTITSGTWKGTTVAIAHGGTGATTAESAFAALAPAGVKGDIMYHNGTKWVALNKGTKGQILHATDDGVEWTSTISAGTF